MLPGGTSLNAPLDVARRFIASNPEAAEIVHQLISSRRKLGLTERQIEVLDFIRTRISRNGMAPTFQEISDHLGIASKSSVHRLITALEERGHIERIPGRVRAIKLK
jgi:DNA-binding MarR family transcriptional regulator